MSIDLWKERMTEWRRDLELKLDPEAAAKVSPEPLKLLVDGRITRWVARYRAARKRRPHRIEFSTLLFPDEVKPTFANAFAHLVVEVVHGRTGRSDGHGWEWQAVMKRFGFEPNPGLPGRGSQRRHLAKTFPAMRKQLWTKNAPAPSDSETACHPGKAGTSGPLEDHD